MSLNEGTTELILENNSLRHSSNLGHFKMKCISSSGSVSTPFNIQVTVAYSNFNKYR